MRGIVFTAITVFWILCIIIIFAVGEIGLSVGGGKQYYLPVEIEVYSMSNALDASKVYMDTALRYSVYQACYDTLKNGGWPDIAKVPDGERALFEGKPYAPIRTTAEFRSGLAETILSNVNTYASMDYSFFDSYEVRVPSYQGSEFVELMPDRLTVKATSGSPLQICKPDSCKLDKPETESGADSLPEADDYRQQPNMRELVVLQKDSGLQEAIQTPCYGLYRQGVEESGRLTAKMNEEIAGEMASLQSGIQKPDANACNLVTGEAASRIEDILEADGVEVIDVTLTFAQIEYDNANKLCSLKGGSATAKAKVTIDGPADQTFPVWNGQELAFEPLTLNFVVKTTYNYPTDSTT